MLGSKFDRMDKEIEPVVPTNISWIQNVVFSFLVGFLFYTAVLCFDQLNGVYDISMHDIQKVDMVVLEPLKAVIFTVIAYFVLKKESKRMVARLKVIRKQPKAKSVAVLNTKKNKQTKTKQNHVAS